MRRIPSLILGLVFLIGAAASNAQPASPAEPLQQHPVRAGGLPDVYGTQDIAYVTIPQWEFHPWHPDMDWGDTGGLQPMKYGKTFGAVFLAPVHLPSGAKLASVEYDYCDDSALPESTTLTLISMDYLNNTETLPLATIQSVPNSGCGSASVDLRPLDYTVINYDKRLALQVEFAFTTTSVERFAGAILGYQLQVSAPGSGAPHFADVPPGDSAYQFIEALYASGVSVGCGGGNYCPDAPLTRRQMAVFLAKALGLHFQ
jgi:hypothetical protein